MPYTSEQNDFLVNTYKIIRNTRLTLDSFESKWGIRPSKAHLYNLLKPRGIERNPVGGDRKSLTGLTQEQFTYLFNYYDGDAILITRILDRKERLIYKIPNFKKICRDYGLKPNHIPHQLSYETEKYLNAFKR